MKIQTKTVLYTFLTIVSIYFLFSYIILPIFWSHYEHHPALRNLPKTTQTKGGIPGDPLNIGLIGTETEIINVLLQAGWSPADPLTLFTTIKVTASVIFNRPYPDAPVSNLYLRGRKEDLAFEQVVGKSPRKRHHVRFWRSDELGKDGRPLWLGAATFDRSVGLSRFTGHITHHIAPDIDMERDKLIDDIEQAGLLLKIYQVTGIGPVIKARNGEGDWYYTDGELTIGVLSVNNVKGNLLPERLKNPSPVEFKNSLWEKIRSLLKYFEPK